MQTFEHARLMLQNAHMICHVNASHATSPTVSGSGKREERDDSQSQECLHFRRPWQSYLIVESAALCFRGWRAGQWICTDHRTSLRSAVELRSEIRIQELAELGAILHVVGSISPHNPKFAEGRPFSAVGLEFDKINEIASDVVIGDGILT